MASVDMAEIDKIVGEVMHEPGAEGVDDDLGAAGTEAEGQTDASTDSTGDEGDRGSGGEGGEENGAEGGEGEGEETQGESDKATDRTKKLEAYRALADKRIVELDRQNVLLRERLKQIEATQQVDWRARAKDDPRAVAEELGISFESLLGAYAGGQAPNGDEHVAHAVLPPEVQERLKLLDRIPDLEKRIAEEDSRRRESAKQGLYAEARESLSSATDGVELARLMPAEASELYVQIKAAWWRMHGTIPGPADLVPAVEEGMRMKYPDLAKRLAQEPQKKKEQARKAQAGIESAKSGAAEQQHEESYYARLQRIIDEEVARAG